MPKIPSNYETSSYFVIFLRVPGLTSLPLGSYQFFSPIHFSKTVKIANFSRGRNYQNETLTKENIKQFSSECLKDPKYTKSLTLYPL